jgi:hypothetical protein
MTSFLKVILQPIKIMISQLKEIFQLRVVVQAKNKIV